MIQLTARSQICCAGLVGFLAIVSATAQPVPKITSISPDWVQRGTSSTVTLEGENLSQVDGFIFSGEGGLSAAIAPPPVYSAKLETSRGGIVPADNDEKNSVSASRSRPTRLWARATCGWRRPRVSRNR